MSLWTSVDAHGAVSTVLLFAYRKTSSLKGSSKQTSMSRLKVKSELYNIPQVHFKFFHHSFISRPFIY